MKLLYVVTELRYGTAMSFVPWYKNILFLGIQLSKLFSSKAFRIVENLGSESTFFIKFSVLKNIIFIDEIYLLIVFLVPLYLAYLKKEIINIYYLIFFTYLCFVYTLEFHGRHYFYLEIFSILIFVNLTRYLFKFFSKVKNQQYKFNYASKK